MAAAAATLKKVSMELGGKNPQVIFPDADMDAALDAAAFGAYFNAGECCNAGSRILLHADIADEFLAALAERATRVEGRRPARSGDAGRRDHHRRSSRQDRVASEGSARKGRGLADWRRAARIERSFHGADDRRERRRRRWRSRAMRCSVRSSSR